MPSAPYEPGVIVEPVIVVGGGPGGLTAALELTRLGIRPHVIEKSERLGGLARTESFMGAHFDMGGHRFYTKWPEIEALWREVLGEDLLVRPRLSRIYYRGRFFPYPLQIGPTLTGLGFIESVRIAASYLKAMLSFKASEASFAQWVTHRFGRRLFETFFKSYTEKVWGVSTHELRADWAEQRLKGLSVSSLVRGALGLSSGRVRSLVETFSYPRLGPGLMWKRVADIVRDRGGRVDQGGCMIEVHHGDDRVASIVTRRGDESVETRTSALISSMPIGELVFALRPIAPEAVIRAARDLKHRDFLTVGLIVRKADVFPDNWIYIHDPSVDVARIQNYGNWSRDMAPDPATSSLGFEYFCNEGDERWATPDHLLIAQARAELEALGFARSSEVEAGVVYRMSHAYPLYDGSYKESLDTVKDYLRRFANIETIGRNGLHRYNNQDHSMMTGLLAARNVAAGLRIHDVWSVGHDDGYLEEVRS